MVRLTATKYDADARSGSAVLRALMSEKQLTAIEAMKSWKQHMKGSQKLSPSDPSVRWMLSEMLGCHVINEGDSILTLIHTPQSRNDLIFKRETPHDGNEGEHNKHDDLHTDDNEPVPNDSVGIFRSWVGINLRLHDRPTEIQHCRKPDTFDEQWEEDARVKLFRLYYIDNITGNDVMDSFLKNFLETISYIARRTVEHKCRQSVGVLAKDQAYQAKKSRVEGVHAYTMLWAAYPSAVLNLEALTSTPVTDALSLRIRSIGDSMRSIITDTHFTTDEITYLRNIIAETTETGYKALAQVGGTQVTLLSSEGITRTLLPTLAYLKTISPYPATVLIDEGDLIALLPRAVESFQAIPMGRDAEGFAIGEMLRSHLWLRNKNSVRFTSILENYRVTAYNYSQDHLIREEYERVIFHDRPPGHWKVGVSDQINVRMIEPFPSRFDEWGNKTQVLENILLDHIAECDRLELNKRNKLMVLDVLSTNKEQLKLAEHLAKFSCRQNVDLGILMDIQSPSLILPIPSAQIIGGTSLSLRERLLDWMNPQRAAVIITHNNNTRGISQELPRHPNGTIRSTLHVIGHSGNNTMIQESQKLERASGVHEGHIDKVTVYVTEMSWWKGQMWRAVQVKESRLFRDCLEKGIPIPATSAEHLKDVFVDIERYGKGVAIKLDRPIFELMFKSTFDAFSLTCSVEEEALHLRKIITICQR